jgi:capsular exopolysaccharide synthesis family protein
MKRDLSPRSLSPDLLAGHAAGAGGWHEHAPQGAAASGPAPITPRMVLNVLRRWWKLSLMIGLVLGTAAGGIAWFTYKPTYEARAWLRSRPYYILDKQTFDPQAFMVTQRELIRSPPIISEALAKPGISRLPIFDKVEDPPQWLASMLDVRSISGSELFTIGLRDSYRGSVAKVVNAVKDAYLAHLNTDSIRQNDQILVTLDQERARRYAEMENDRNRLRTLVVEADGNANPNNLELNQTQLKIMNPLDQLSAQLATLDMELILEKADFDALQKTIADPSEIRVSAEAINEQLNQQPDVAKLLEDLDKTHEMLAKATTGASDSSSIAAGRKERMQAKIADLESKLASLKKKMRPQIEESLHKGALSVRDEQIRIREKEIEMKERKKAALNDQLMKMREEAQKAGQNNLAIRFLQEDLDRRKLVYDKIVDRIETIKTEQRVHSPVSMLMEATEPIAAIDGGPAKRSLLFGTIALILPFAGFLLWELKSRRIGDIDEFRNLTNLRVVGEISTLPVRSKFVPGAARKFEESLTRFEESIDYLRTSLLIARHQRAMQSIVVCSAASREGKSTVSAHLASSLARGISGRVLLVDADMRRPHLHRLLDQDPENGLVDYLAGRVEINNIIRSTWVDRLDFVASGVLDTPVGVLLASDRFERFLRAVEKQYEFIVIDVPPILPVSEGLVISKAADGAIFCVLRDVSTTANVSRACEKLRNAGVHILGAVFNGVPAREYGSSGYYYYRIPQTNGSVDKVDVN